ncbi:3_t:CDS:2 [Diversispora eburnea]|uniref:3_t:CDS:1 n=1 Tax=Diversispora eburnea TaxID=1213867 RepID=A0A9N9C7V9_9GLOM|nr:3_t:CDS:2 [Diversispora eburnea]
MFEEICPQSIWLNDHVTKEIQRINEQELNRNIQLSGSWHDQYSDSPYIFVGNIPFDLTEGDIISVFSQYGEILDVQLVRDKKTGTSKGFGFLKYEDQRSTILAVDNLNNTNLLGRTIRVDHASAKTKDGQRRMGMNAVPSIINETKKSSTSSSEDEFADKYICHAGDSHRWAKLTENYVILPGGDNHYW